MRHHGTFIAIVCGARLIKSKMQKFLENPDFTRVTKTLAIRGQKRVESIGTYGHAESRPCSVVHAVLTKRRVVLIYESPQNIDVVTVRCTALFAFAACDRFGEQ